MSSNKAVPVEPTALLAAFDKAVADELPRVSHVEYDSHEICKHFASKVRARIASAPPSPVTELEVMLAEAIDGILTADSMCSDACLIQSDDLQSRANKLHHDSMEKARAALSDFNAKKGGRDAH